MGKISDFCSKEFIVNLIFEYETQKMVQIRSAKIGLIFRLFQVVILIYLVGWVMILEKGYQSFESVTYGVSTKVKGISFTNLSHKRSVGRRVWDAADYTIPPQQNGAFFILTNVIITPDQTQRYCPESADVRQSSCRSNIDCPVNYVNTFGHGVYTGRCLRNISRCEVFAWCPLESDPLPFPDRTPFTDVVNFTVLIKNSIEFPTFKVKRRNVLSWMDKSYIRSCFNNPDHPRDKYCPILRMGDIFKYAKVDPKRLLMIGGIMAITINWECDLDQSVEDCLPEYTFSQLDDSKDKVAEGWNFRYAYHYRDMNQNRRILIKAYGIQFVIHVTGRGGKFDLLTFTMNCGSSAALFGTATVFCDMIILYFLKNKKVYRQAKCDTLIVSKAIAPAKKDCNKDCDKDCNKTAIAEQQPPGDDSPL